MVAGRARSAMFWGESMHEAGTAEFCMENRYITCCKVDTLKSGGSVVEVVRGIKRFRLGNPQKGKIIREPWGKKAFRQKGGVKVLCQRTGLH